MIGPRGSHGVRSSRRRSLSPIRWAVRAVPRPALALLLLVELATAVVLVADLARGIDVLPDRWPLLLAVLVGAGILGTEASLGVERMRRRSDEGPHLDLSSVWTFAAAVLLPAALAGVIVALVYLHIHLRVWRRSGVPLYRVVFTTCTVLLAVHAAAAVVPLHEGPGLFGSVTGLLTVLLALVTFAVVNLLLVVSMIALTGRRPAAETFVQALGIGDETVLEFATLSMGALAAGAMAAFGPAHAVLVLPPLIVLHRTVLVRQLEEAASTDGKTGLLNAAAWQVQADRALRRTERGDGRCTVLLLDLDHFKLVNDRHGHLVGDQVLVEVATAIRSELRDDDLVGRFGGEEFVVLLPGLDLADPGAAGGAVAERIRRLIEAVEVPVPGTDGPVGVTASIGGATDPADGVELAELLEVADAAMYAAKQAGRNTVRMGLHGPPRVEAGAEGPRRP